MFIRFWWKHFEFVLFPKSGPHPGTEKPQISLMFPLCSGNLELPAPANTLLRLWAGHLRLKHTSPATWKKNTKKLLSKKPLRLLCLKRQRQKLLQPVSSEPLLGRWLSGTFPWGVHFFLPSAPVSAKDNFAGSSARAPQLGQMELEFLFPAVGSSAPFLTAPHQGSHCRALGTQIQQRKSSLESPGISSTSCGWGWGSLSHKALFHWGCPALTSDSLRMMPRAAGSIKSREDKYAPQQVQSKCQHTNVSRHPTSHLSCPNPFKHLLHSVSCLQTTCKHSTGSLGEEIALWSYSLLGVNVTSRLE